MNKRTLSHDILNMLERLRIMHDLALDENYHVITKTEMKIDLEVTLKTLEERFKELLQ